MPSTGIPCLPVCRRGMTGQRWEVELPLPVMLEEMEQEVVTHKSPPRLSRGGRLAVESNLPRVHWLGGREEGDRGGEG